ncbi:polymer-forming cytoskeletal protein [Deinococcus petrolearius]|uniref:Polymer-forming cytoskeletal protein n=1 Tax=Deinococcus petrolearius TaxID=1751295 RepID=A0ABW1DEP2_9DEIO
MGQREHNSGGRWERLGDGALRAALHREADHDLNETEVAQLGGAPAEVQAARAALRRATASLSGLERPPLPHSVAPAVLSDIAAARSLTPPPLPRSVASAAVRDLRLGRMLTPPVPESSVAPAVLSDLAAARWLAPPPAPRPVAGAVLAELRLARQLTPPVPARSVAVGTLTEMTGAAALTSLPRPPLPGSVAPAVLARIAPAAAAPTVGTAPAPLRLLAAQPQNPAPLLLVGGLLAGVVLLTLSTAWPNLAAGAVVLRALLEQVSPLAAVGLALLLLTSVVVAWKPVPAVRRAGAGAFALSAVLALPALYHVAGGDGGLSIGRSVTVSGPVSGNVIAIGGDVRLGAQAQVGGEVVTLLGDVYQAPGAQVGGRVNALLGHAPGDRSALQTAPPTGLGLATAAAFRPVLGWLGAAAWPQVFVVLTGGALLLLFVAGLAPGLARRQRHAPMRTLALGVLLLAVPVGPAAVLGLAGLLAPALLALALAALLVATGLSVSLYDLGRLLAQRVRLPVPDAVGALIGLSAFAASLSLPPLAFTLALVGGAWGAGTLLLTRLPR